MKQELLILTIILGTALAACGGNGEEPVPATEPAARANVAATPAWQATDIIMSYWAKGEDDPNRERVLESLRTFSTK